MTTIKVKFRPSTVAGRPGSIVYLVTHRRVVRQITTGYKIYPDEWDEKQATLIARGNKDDDGRSQYITLVAKRIRQDMERLDAVIREQENKSTGFTSDDVVASFHGFLKSHSFRNFMAESIDRLKRLDKERTAETYTSAMNSFMRFRGGRDVLFDEITSDLMMEYEAWLRGNGVKKNTVSFYNRILRAVYNRAVEKELVVQHYPFKHVYTGIDKTVKRAITLEEIKKIKELDLSFKPSLDFARDMFLFSFYTRGMSFVDMAYLKREDLQNGMLTYCRKKTGQRLSIRWEPCMQQIVERYPNGNPAYLLPILVRSDSDERRQYKNVGHLINRNLRKLGRELGLAVPLTMYVARHTWASVARSRNIPLSVISESMGHDSEATTRIYLASLDTAVVDQANRLVINSLSEEDLG